MPLPYVSTNYAVAQAVSGYTLEAAFDGSNERVIARQTWQQARENYTPLPLDTVEVINGANYYLVEESPLIDMGGQESQWERIWARVPSSRSEWIAFPYEMPAIQSVPVYGNFTGVSVTASPPKMKITMPGNPFGNGATVGLRYTAANTTFETTRGPVTSADAMSFDLPYHPGFASGSNQAVASVTQSGGRELPTTIITRAEVLYEYYLPGVTPNIATPEDIPIDTLFEITLNGFRVSFVSDATVPDTLTYLGFVASKTLLTAEDTFQRWRGNIYERRRVRFLPL
jgi:hypothetical protein